MIPILHWGGEWFVEGGAFAPPSDEPAAIAQSLRTFLEERGHRRPHRLRLLYQPDTLHNVAVACPAAGRDVVRRALTEEFPALADPATAWGMLPAVRGSDDRASTLLFVEEGSPLTSLSAALRDNRCTVNGAWPLAAAFEQLAATADFAVGLCASSRALIYRRSRDGRRELHSFVGPNFRAEVSAELRRMAVDADRSKLVPLLWLCLDGARDSVALPEECETAFAVQGAELGDLLAIAGELSVGHPANLLAPEKAVAGRILFAASAALVAASLWTGYAYTRDYLALQRSAAAHAADAAALRAEIAVLEDNRRKIEALDAMVAQGAPLRRSQAELLRRIAAVIPREVTLVSYRSTGTTFTLVGSVATNPSRRDDPLVAFAAALQRGASCTVTAAPTRAADGSFSLTGSFAQ